jgi:hypothetical protein
MYVMTGPLDPAYVRPATQSHLTTPRTSFCPCRSIRKSGYRPSAAGRADARRLIRATDRYQNGRRYLNFLEEGGSTARGYDPASFARPQQVRRRVDPTGLSRANHEKPIWTEVVS